MSRGSQCWNIEGVGVFSTRKIIILQRAYAHPPPLIKIRQGIADKGLNKKTSPLWINSTINIGISSPWGNYSPFFKRKFSTDFYSIFSLFFFCFRGSFSFSRDFFYNKGIFLIFCKCGTMGSGLGRLGGSDIAMITAEVCGKLPWLVKGRYALRMCQNGAGYKRSLGRNRGPRSQQPHTPSRLLQAQQVTRSWRWVNFFLADFYLVFFPPCFSPLHNFFTSWRVEIPPLEILAVASC